jgi:hypothetical protein
VAEAGANSLAVLAAKDLELKLGQSLSTISQLEDRLKQHEVGLAFIMSYTCNYHRADMGIRISV